MWNHSSLWEKTMRMLVNSSPEVKILSLKVIIQFMQCILVDEKVFFNSKESFCFNSYIT